MAKAYIRVQADAGSLGSDFRDIRAQTEHHLQGVKKSALAVLGIFSGGMAGILRSGLQAAGTFEQTTIAFETMLGSAEETQKVLNDLTMFAAKTPFEMPEITQAARGLIQFGERGQELMDTLNILGNAASGTSTPFGFLALVFNQVRGVGKLLTQDFRQLSTRGIVSMQDLADYLGVSLSEAEKKLSSGAIKFEDLRKLLKKLSSEGGRFFRLMERQSTSLLGLGSTLNDAWNIMFRILAQSLMPAAKAFTSTMVRVVEMIQNAVIWTDGLASAALAGATGLSVLATGFLAVGLASRFAGVGILGFFVGSGIAALIVTLGAGLGVLVDKFNLLGQAASAIGTVFTALQDFGINLWEWMKVIYINWDGIWNEFPKIVEIAFSYVGDIISNAGPLLGQTMGYALSKMLDMAKSFAATFVNIFLKMVSSVGQLWKAYQEGGITAVNLLAASTVASVMKMSKGFSKGLSGIAPDWTEIFTPSERTVDKILDRNIVRLYQKMDREKMLFEKDRAVKAGVPVPDATKASPAQTLLEQGRYGLPEMASKIQDKFLKKDDGLALDKDRNSLLEAGLTKQDEIIKAIGAKDISAVLTGGE